jgi:hypothetical protein
VAKQTGLGDLLLVSGYDISGDTQQIGGLSTPIATLEMTGINKFAHERQHGLASAQGEFVTFFNDADNAEHEVLSTLPRSNGHLMYLRGSARGGSGFASVGKRIDYAGSRGDDGSLTFSVTFNSDGFVADWGQQLTAGLETITAAGNTAGVQVGAASFGWQAHLEVTAFTGTSATVKLQSSSDDGATDAYADVAGGAFTTVTGATWERLASSSDTAAVEEYVRLNVAGTFSSLTFAVVFNRNAAPRSVA